MNTLTRRPERKQASWPMTFTTKIISDNAEVLDKAIIYDRDFSYDYFGFKTLERSYFLLRTHGQVG